MSSYFHQPANALKRANELMLVGNTEVALQTLHDVFAQRRFNKQWEPIYEDLIFKYMELCVRLKDHRLAKEGLYQYRQLCMGSQAYKSLDKSIRYLLEMAEAKAESARASVAAGSSLAEVEDLDEESEGAVGDPEDVLLSTVTGDTMLERRQRDGVVKWIKFLWESYRAVLEQLKLNSKLEATYHATARAAFQFCVSYKRTAEFRRLCELLRTHLQNLSKLDPNASPMPDKSRRNSWEGWTERSIERQLQTKFDQLRTGGELGMWNEAFKTVADINDVMHVSKKKFKNRTLDGATRARLMATFYDHLKHIFFVSKKHLFHAYTWSKFHAVCKDHNRALDEDALAVQATSVLLATLAVPPSTSRDAALGSVDVEDERNQRIAAMLNFSASAAPTRDSMLRDLEARGVIASALPQARRLFELLEQSFNPQSLVEQVAPLLKELLEVGEAARAEADALDAARDPKARGGRASAEDDDQEVGDAEDAAAERRAAEAIARQTPRARANLALYVGPIRRVLVLRLLQQLSRVYATVRLEKLHELTSALGLTPLEVETAVVDAVADKRIAALVDHASACIRFPSPAEPSAARDTAAARAAREEAVRGQLSSLAAALSRAAGAIAGGAGGAAEAARARVVAAALAGAEEEHARVLGRKAVIEQRKESLEREELERREAAAARRREREREQARQEEERKVAAEAERKRLTMERLEKQRQLEVLKSSVEAVGGDLELDLDKPLEELDVSALQDLVLEQRRKAHEAKEKEAKRLADKAKRLDYIVRALRHSEIPLLRAADEKAAEDGRVFHAEAHEKAIAEGREEHARTLAKRGELLKAFPAIFSAVEDYAAARTAARREAHAAKCEELQREARDIAFRRAKARARQRKEEHEERLREEEEEERRRAEEEKEREEASRRRREAEREAEMRAETEAARNVAIKKSVWAEDGEEEEDDDDDDPERYVVRQVDMRAAPRAARRAEPGDGMYRERVKEDDREGWSTVDGGRWRPSRRAEEDDRDRRSMPERPARADDRSWGRRDDRDRPDDRMRRNFDRAGSGVGAANGAAGGRYRPPGARGGGGGGGDREREGRGGRW